MTGRGRLAGLPALTPHQEKSLFRAVFLMRLPEEGSIDADAWIDLVVRDLDRVRDNSTGSYWSYHLCDGDDHLGEIDLLQSRDYCERSGITFWRNKGKVAGYFKRLNEPLRLWLARLETLTPLDTLAGL